MLVFSNSVRLVNFLLLKSEHSQMSMANFNNIPSKQNSKLFLSILSNIQGIHVNELHPYSYVSL